MDIFIRLETLKYKVLRSLTAKKMEIEGLQFFKIKMEEHLFLQKVFFS